MQNQGQFLFDQLQQRDSLLQPSLLQMTQDYDELYLNYIRLEAKSEKLKHSLDRRNTSNPETPEAFTSLQEENTHLNNKVTQYYTELNQTQEKLQAQISQYQGLSLKFEEQVKQNSALRESFKAVNDSYRAQGDKLVDISMKLEDTVQERDRLKEAKGKLEKEMEDMESMVNKLREMIMEEKQNTLDQLNQLNDELDKSKGKIKELQEERQRYKDLKKRFLEIMNKTPESVHLKVHWKDEDNPQKLLEPKKKLQMHTSEINSIADSSTTDMIATCGNDGEIKFYSPSSLKNLSGMVLKPQSMNEVPTAICFGFDNESFVSGTSDRKVYLWSLSKQQVVMSHSEHNSGVTSVIFTKDMSKIVSSGNDKTIKIWDISKKMLAGNIDCGEICNVLAVNNNDKDKILGGFKDGSVRVYSLKSQQIVKEYKGIHAGCVTSLCLDKAGKILLVGSKEGVVKMIDMKAEKVMAVEFRHEEYKNSCENNKVSFVDKDGKFVIAGGDDGKVFVWNRESGKICYVVESDHMGAVSGCVCNYSSGKVYTVDCNGATIMWSLA